MNANERAVLDGLGWNDHFASAFESLDDPTLIPARITVDYGSRVLLEGVDGPHDALISIRWHLPPILTLPHKGGGTDRIYPQGGRDSLAVGDWVAAHRRADRVIVEKLLPRFSAITRTAADSEAEAQVLAANIDLVFITTALGADFNLRRIERLLTLAYQSGASPVVLLTKADLVDADPYETELREVAPGVPTITVSAVRGDGLDAVREQLPIGKTGVLLGSSGVGKSTLVNRLLHDERLRTRDVHGSGQGRHTTSHRQLMHIPDGGLIIDTPGLREIQLSAGDEALGEVFGDIEALATGCRFRDCRHDREPGCAVRAAVADGGLDGKRFRSYQKLQRELRSIAARADVRLQIEDRRKWKLIHRAATEHMKLKRRLG